MLSFFHISPLRFLYYSTHSFFHFRHFNIFFIKLRFFFLFYVLHIFYPFFIYYFTHMYILFKSKTLKKLLRENNMLSGIEMYFLSKKLQLYNHVLFPFITCNSKKNNFLFEFYSTTMEFFIKIL